jgi:hypothetical protein
MNAAALLPRRLSVGQADKGFHPQGIVYDSIKIVLLYFLTIMVIYKGPYMARFVYFPVLYLIFWQSKKNYFWFAFIFILATCPGNFFSESGASDAPYRLPLFSLGPGMSFTTEELFAAVALLKALLYGKKYKFVFRKKLKPLFYYIIVLLGLSLTAYGAGMKTLTDLLRNTFFYSFLVSIPYLVLQYEDLERMIYLLFPFMFSSFAMGIYFFVTGDYFLNLINPGGLRVMRIVGGGLRYGFAKGEHMLILFCFISALTFCLAKQNRSFYLKLVAMLSYFSILMTATRVWFVVYSLILMVYLVKSMKNVKNFISMVLMLSAAFGVVSAGGGSQMSSAVDRIFSIFNYGDKSSKARRMVEQKKAKRLPKVLNGIYENPLLGWGFSDKAVQIMDEDVGNYSLIAQVGLIGISMFISFWIGFLTMIRRTRKKLLNKNPFKDALSILNMAMIGFLIAHHTTHQVFGLTLLAFNLFFMSLFILLSEFALTEARRVNAEMLDIRTQLLANRSALDSSSAPANQTQYA